MAFKEFDMTANEVGTGPSPKEAVKAATATKKKPECAYAAMTEPERLTFDERYRHLGETGRRELANLRMIRARQAQEQNCQM
jgi:hypothetical protein